MPRKVYRLPRVIAGPRVYMYNEVKDQQPWSLVSQKIEPRWAETKGKGITVAVLDTGLWKHRDLPDPAFVGNFSSSGSPYDFQGHGTHVAGTIGARLNGAGVVGYAPECNIGCVKVLGDDGTGTTDAIAQGIYFAAEQGARIINMSLGGGYDPVIAQACRDVIQQGVFVICAAGNDGELGSENTIGWPARLPEVLAIGSFNQSGEISEFSSRGPEVCIAFPGEDILSTWPNNTFRRLSGTSMATPAASGLTALMLAYHRDNPVAVKTPIKNNSDLREHWKRHAQDVGAPGKDNSFGWGIPKIEDIIHNGLPGNDAPGTTPPVAPPAGGMVIVPEGPGIEFGQFGCMPVSTNDRTGLFVYTRK